MDTDDRRPLRIDRSFNAPVGRVFRAWTTPEERVTVELAANAGRTDMVFVHDGVPVEQAREEHRKGWTNAFDVLEARLCGP